MSLAAALRERADDLSAWLRENAPGCHAEQRHLDEGTPERAYWHYGYATAIKDVLALLGSTSTSKH